MKCFVCRDRKKSLLVRPYSEGARCLVVCKSIKSFKFYFFNFCFIFILKTRERSLKFLGITNRACLSHEGLLVLKKVFVFYILVFTAYNKTGIIFQFKMKTYCAEPLHCTEICFILFKLC